MSYNHENLIVGCGNILYNDDGFGPSVIKEINNNKVNLPGDTVTIDCGTSAPYYLFSLPEDKWKQIILIDIASMNEKPGTIKTLKLNQINDYNDNYTLTLTKCLHKLENTVNIKIIACQPKKIPSTMSIGLTKEVEESIPKVIENIIKLLS